MNEEWRTIPSFPDYDVSDHGNIRRKDGKPLTIGKTTDGYPSFTFRKNGKPYKRTIHQYVLEAFVGPRPPKHDTCHNDGSKNNNHISNLRWDTRKNNIADARKHGAFVKGSRHGSAKLTEKQVLKIRSDYPEYNYSRLAERYKVTKNIIHCIVKRKTWKHI